MRTSLFAIVDIETTGMRSERDRIIEIGIILMEGDSIVRTYSTLINPECPVSPGATLINGITNEKLAMAPTFDEVALQIDEMLRGAVFVAHNVRFDYQFVKKEFQRLGMEFRLPYLCSVELSRFFYPKAQRHNLDALIKRHNFDCESRHRAYDDAHVVFQFLQAVKKEFGAKVFWKTLEEKTVGGGRNAPYENSLRELPDSPGVYYLYGDSNDLLYIGKSKNVRTRVRSHFSPSAGEHHLREGTVRIASRSTPGELSALLLESHAIKNESPVFNRKLRKPKKMVVAFEQLTQEGYRTVELRTESELPNGENIAAIFRTMTAARQNLREIAKEHFLCQKLLGLEKTAGTCFGSQIGLCKKACAGAESVEAYNARFVRAFKKRQIKTWPFSGAVRIEERDHPAGDGAVFIIKEWRILKSYVYDAAGIREFLPALPFFDYDTYKILVRYILNPANRSRMREISESDLDDLKNQVSGDYETVIQ